MRLIALSLLLAWALPSAAQMTGTIIGSVPTTPPWTDVRTYGTVCNGTTDDTTAIQAALDATPYGGLVQFPQGICVISATLVVTNKKLHLQGVGQSVSGNAVGTQLRGSVNGPLLQSTTSNGPGTFLEHLALRNTHATGTGVHMENFTVGGLRNVTVQAFIGIYMPANSFTFLIDQVHLSGLPGAPVGSIGIVAGTHTQITASDIVGFDEGIRASGATVNITGCRFEVNRIGIRVGIAANGSVFALSRSAIVGNSMEANDVGIQIASMAHSILGALAVNGSVNSPSGQSQLGIDMAGGSDITLQNVAITGTFSQAAVRISGTQTRNKLAQVVAGNAFPGADTWDVRVPVAHLEFDQTNYSLRGDGVVTPVYKERSVLKSLAAVDHTLPMVLGRNLRGKNVPVAASATTKAVVFPVTLNAGVAALNTVTAGSGAGTLAEGTYFYIATQVHEGGESGATSEKTVTVSAPNNQVALTFAGGVAAHVKRRVYRGTATGVYDGYFELAYGSSTFTDTGTAFTGVKSVPVGSDAETTMQEPDANYAVIVTPAWNTTVWITSKATTGFTIHFGTAPGADSTLDWFIVR